MQRECRLCQLLTTLPPIRSLRHPSPARLFIRFPAQHGHQLGAVAGRQIQQRGGEVFQGQGFTRFRISGATTGATGSFRLRNLLTGYRVRNRLPLVLSQKTPVRVRLGVLGHLVPFRIIRNLLAQASNRFGLPSVLATLRGLRHGSSCLHPKAFFMMVRIPWSLRI